MLTHLCHLYFFFHSVPAVLLIKQTRSFLTSALARVQMVCFHVIHENIRALGFRLLVSTPLSCKMSAVPLGVPSAKTT